MINRLIPEKSRRVMLDMLINLAGTALPLIVLQLIVYPIVGKVISAEEYGRMQSVMSVVYLISGTIGGALSTARLVSDYDYKERKLSADFGLLSLLCSFIVAVLTPVVLYVYLGDSSGEELLLVTLISLFNYLAAYFEVGFRLALNYKRIFINKLLSGVGYVLGFMLFRSTLRWEIIFITAFFLQAVFCVFTSGLIREPLSRSALFGKTGTSFINLSAATCLNKAMTYCDKLLLYPLLGGEAVSVYYAANIFGKLVLQVLEPITNVVLSYLSKEKRVSRSVWKLTATVGGVFCIVMYFFCLLISRFVLGLLYPQWAEAAVKLVPVTTLSLCFSSFVNIINPLALKQLKTGLQIVISASGLLVYIAAALLLYRVYGLIGCCWALLFCYIVRLVLIMAFCMAAGKRMATYNEC